ncbi:MAG: hypothetical protein IJ887_14660 [Prevotella sp.]|nr:hypothetical protein [Prevotella sp.]
MQQAELEDAVHLFYGCNLRQPACMQNGIDYSQKKLADAGLIKFTNGRGRRVPPKYTLLEWSDKLTVKRTEDLTHYNTKDIDSRQAQREKVIPTVADVESYMATCVIPAGFEMKAGLPQRFHDYYESKNWMVGNSPMADWKATARKWTKDTQNLIKKSNGTDRCNKECGRNDNRSEARNFVEELEQRTIRTANGE